MLPRPMVLLVIDDQTVWDFFKLPLETEGFDVNAIEGKELFNEVSYNPPDIILLDLIMPENNVYRVFDYLKANENTRHIPVILLVSKDNIEEGINGLETGAVDYLCRPFHLREAIVRIKIHLQFKEYEDKLVRKNQELEKYSSLLMDFNSKLEELARKDELTQIWNRRAFNEQIAQLHNYSLRYERPYSIIIIDLDHFKKYNDFYGHQKGDIVLKKVAEAIEKTCRLTDFVARYGGEEIMVLLPETGEDEAIKIAERIINSVRELAIEHEQNQNIDIVTVSVGLATYRPKAESEEDWEALLKKADDALYQAKESGRNCVCKL